MKLKSYDLLFVTALILFLASFLLPEAPMDIHLHDTYYVITIQFIFWILSLISLLVWVIYKLTARFLFSNFLTWLHILVTLLSVIVFIALLFTASNLYSPTPRKYYDYSNWDSMNDLNTYSRNLTILLFILVAAQVLYVINFLGGLVKRKK